MKYFILTLSFACIGTLAAQTTTADVPTTQNTSLDSPSIENMYIKSGLNASIVRDMIMQVAGLGETQAQNALPTYLHVILQAREEPGAANMSAEGRTFFKEHFGTTDLQLEDLQKVALRFAMTRNK